MTGNFWTIYTNPAIVINLCNSERRCATERSPTYQNRPFAVQLWWVSFFSILLNFCHRVFLFKTLFYITLPNFKELFFLQKFCLEVLLAIFRRAVRNWQTSMVYVNSHSYKIQCGLSMMSWSIHTLFFWSIHTLFTALKGYGTTKTKKSMDRPRHH